MKTKLLLVCSLVLPCFLATTAAADKKISDQDVADSLTSFKRTDPELKKFFDSAAGYAIFPKVGKGGFIAGGAHGSGMVYEKGHLIGEASLTQVTVGAQVGGQVYSELLFFESQRALDDFKSGNFELSAQVSAVAAAEGASRNAKYQNGVAIFTHAQGGLMAEAAIGGQKFKFKPISKK